MSAALAQVLVRRGLDSPAGRAQAFLQAGESHPPSAFAGIGAAAATIARHVATGSRITIHGDYDVDGVCSTAVLLRALRALGQRRPLPARSRGDGYGLSEATVRRLAARGTRLLVTADCAITAVEEVRCARELGMEVVVTDHHTPRGDGALPDAPIVHPRVCGYPFPELCATAVAHKLAQALLEHAAAGPIEGERVALAAQTLREDLDLVALATIADLVPLTGENRALVRRGLRALAGTAKPGLRALMGVAGVPAAGRRARGRVRARAAPERRRAPVPRGRWARADPHRRPRARRGDRA